MPKKVDRKRIKTRAVKMNDAWHEGAPDVVFKGVKQGDLDAKLKNADAKEQHRVDLAAQLKMVDDELDDIYVDIESTVVTVAEGVRGNENYGNDSPLYGAMGFKRKSEYASGLTRKIKTPPGGSS